MLSSLRLPPIADQPDPEVETRAVFLEEWVEALPYAHPVALLDTYLEALRRCNRSPMKVNQRLALLEIFLRPYEYLLELQERQGPIHSVSSIERYRADTEAARRAAEELAYGYKTVLVHGTTRRTLWGGKREGALAAQRAMLFLSLVLIHSYDEYLPIPTGVWPELHALMLYARSEGIDEMAPVGKPKRPEYARDCATTYKQMLLASLVDPYHLGYGLVWKMYQLLGTVADAAVLGPFAKVSRPAGIFVIAPRSDHHPRPYLKFDETPPDGAQLLDANPVTERLQGLASTADGPRRTLIATTMRAFGLPPKRHSPREIATGRVRLTTSLSSLHHFLAGRDSTPPTAPDPAPDSDADIEIDIDADEPTTGATPEHSYTAEYWELLDQGPGGVGVIKRLRPNQAVGVGEIIGIQTPTGDQQGSWSVGVVRWLSIANAGEYQIGVQLMARRAEAVGILAAEATSPSPALLLRGEEGSERATLITAPGLLPKGLDLTLTSAAGETTAAHVERVIERATHFQHLAIRTGD